MNIESFRDLCLSLKGVTEEFPFDECTLVYKVMGKVFALTDVNLFDAVTLKSTPGQVVELQEKYPAVQPGYHMNKKHWITVAMDNSVADAELRIWVMDSYALVAGGLSRAKRAELGLL